MWTRLRHQYIHEQHTKHTHYLFAEKLGQFSILISIHSVNHLHIFTRILIRFHILGQKCGAYNIWLHIIFLSKSLRTVSVAVKKNLTKSFRDVNVYICNRDRLEYHMPIGHKLSNHSMHKKSQWFLVFVVFFSWARAFCFLHCVSKFRFNLNLLRKCKKHPHIWHSFTYHFSYHVEWLSEFRLEKYGWASNLLDTWVAHSNWLIQLIPFISYCLARKLLNFNWRVLLFGHIQ